MQETPEETSQWHLDRRVPISLIGAFVVQSVVLIIWATTLSNGVRELRESFSAHSVLPAHYGMQIDAARVMTQQSTIISRQAEILSALRGIDGRLRELETAGRRP